MYNNIWNTVVTEKQHGKLLKRVSCLIFRLLEAKRVHAVEIVTRKNYYIG